MAFLSKFPEISKLSSRARDSHSVLHTVPGLLGFAHFGLSPRSERGGCDWTLFAFRVLRTLPSTYAGLFMKQLQLTAEDQKILFWEVS